MKLLSIIIPYYETLNCTLKLLEELNSQLTSAVEIILVDDGCYELALEKYSIQIPNSGVSRARNVGLDNAKGEFVTFIDSDDFISKNYISTILNAIKTQDFDFCTFGWKSINGDLLVTESIPPWNTSVWNCIYKNTDARFDDGKQIGEDRDFNSLTRKGKGKHIPDILYIYDNRRPESLTRKYCKGEIKIDRELKGNVVVYRSFLSLIGGIETAIYNFCKTFNNVYDITFIYDTADPMQLFRLRRLVKCVKYSGQKIECDKFIFYGFNPVKILDTVKANEVIQQVCCDVKAINFNQPVDRRVHSVFADSKASAESFRLARNQKCGVLHNLFTSTERKRVLHLMTASRLSWEKGYDRMKIMAKRMHELKIPFTWEVFTNDKPNEEIDGMYFRKPRLNVQEYMNGKDYGVQLSETESWCCTATEFLLMSVPMVLTDFPSAFEQIKECKNGFILNRDLTNLDLIIQNMYESNFTYLDYVIPSESEWKKILGRKHTSEYKYENSGHVMVKSKLNYFDTVLQRNVTLGEIFEADQERASLLSGNNHLNTKFVEIMG
jgi:glycosyltransferase involved in cell wall biosynthesis